jgi:hypothetical protein
MPAPPLPPLIGGGGPTGPLPPPPSPESSLQPIPDKEVRNANVTNSSECFRMSEPPFRRRRGYDSARVSNAKGRRQFCDEGVTV